MSYTLYVEWTIVSHIAPQPLIACSTCRCTRPFISSGKARLNANGRKLDAWLIYKCTVCDNTWNRTIFERRHVSDIDAPTLTALQTNDPQWLDALAFNLVHLKQQVRDVAEFSEVIVTKKCLSAPSDIRRVSIKLLLPQVATIRLDRFLACEFGLSRSRVQKLHDDGLLEALPAANGVLRKSIRNGLTILFELSGEKEHERIVALACSQRMCEEV